MKTCCLMFALFMILAASGEQEAGNLTDLTQSQAENAFAQLIEENANSQSIKSLDVILEVFEVDENASVRFGDAKPEEPATLEIYKIAVSNSGRVALDDVVLSAEMAKGIKFDGGARYYEEGRGNLEVTVSPARFNDNISTTLTFNLNHLAPGEVKSIILEAYARENIDNTEVSVEVKGNAPDGEELRKSQTSASVVECEYRVLDNPTDYCNALQIALIESGQKPGEVNCIQQCPDWSEVE